MTISRKTRPLTRDTRILRDATLVVIATEGSETERQYFSIFGNKRVQVKVIPSFNGRSAPNHILINLKKFQQEYNLDKKDILCLAIDKDRYPESMLSLVAAESFKADLIFSVSVPSFEVWLSLHFDAPIPETLRTARDFEDHLRNYLGSYNKSNINLGVFVPGVSMAVSRARALDTNPSHRWPEKIGSRVYRIVEKIQSLYGVE